MACQRPKSKMEKTRDSNKNLPHRDLIDGCHGSPVMAASHVGLPNSNGHVLQAH